MTVSGIGAVLMVWAAFFFNGVSVQGEGKTLSKMTPAEAEEKAQEMMKLTGSAIVPAVVTLDTGDSSVFFLNASTDALITLEIAFGSHRAHCASGNMHIENGIMRSRSPIGPYDFAVVCFPESGSYEVKVYGQNRDGATKAEVIVR